MNNIEKLLIPLNLIYYEYDKDNELIKVDKNYNNEYLKKEFIKITYTLTKNNIIFDVLNAQILINKKLSFFQKVYKNTKDKILEYKYLNSNIFLLNNELNKGVKNIPIFDIKYLDKNINLSKYDALIFTSKNGIKAIDKINKNWKKIPSYVIGKESAKKIKDLDGKLTYISKKNNNKDFTKELIPLLKNKKVLYIRAEKVISNICEILKNNEINCQEEIVYLNVYKENKSNLPKNSKIIFTSPSTVEYFFKSFKWDKSFKAISIGKTTLKSFPSYIKPLLAEKSTLSSCIKKAISID